MKNEARPWLRMVKKQKEILAMKVTHSYYEPAADLADLDQVSTQTRPSGGDRNLLKNSRRCGSFFIRMPR